MKHIPAKETVNAYLKTSVLLFKLTHSRSIDIADALKNTNHKKISSCFIAMVA